MWGQGWSGGRSGRHSLCRLAGQSLFVNGVVGEVDPNPDGLAFIVVGKRIGGARGIVDGNIVR